MNEIRICQVCGIGTSIFDRSWLQHFGHTLCPGCADEVGLRIEKGNVLPGGVIGLIEDMAEEWDERHRPAND